MAKPNFVKKSRKSFRDTFTGKELPAGSSFWWWGAHISATEPTPEQLKQSARGNGKRRIVVEDDKLADIIDKLVIAKPTSEQVADLSYLVENLLGDWGRAKPEQQPQEAFAVEVDSGESKKLFRTAQSGKRNHHRKVKA